MPLYMYEAAYTAESWAAQMKNPQNRVEMVGRAACEAVGGKLIGGWYCFGDYDLVIIADVPNNQSMSAIALAIAAGGAIKASKAHRKTKTVLIMGSRPGEAEELKTALNAVAAKTSGASGFHFVAATAPEGTQAGGQAFEGNWSG